jgi:hypothetical protein
LECIIWQKFDDKTAEKPDPSPKGLWTEGNTVLETYEPETLNP